MDEADLLADHIAILAAPGKLIANGSPVTLKHDLGEGYAVQVTFDTTVPNEKSGVGPLSELLDEIRAVAPQTHTSSPSPHQVSYHLKSRDAVIVEQVLHLLDNGKATYNIASYDILGTSIEDIFLDLMSKEEVLNDPEKTPRDSDADFPTLKAGSMNLSKGRATSPAKQALTILHKRLMIARRSWLTPLLTVLIAVAGAAIPLVFISGRSQSCVRRVRNNTVNIPLYLPASPIVPFTFGPSSRTLLSPPGIITSLGSSAEFLRITDIADNATFVNTITDNYRNLSLGGVSLDFASGNSLIAWEASPPGITGPSMLNLASNFLLNNALNTSGNTQGSPVIIRASYENFPAIAAGTLVSLKWVAFFGAAMVSFDH